MEPSSRCMVCNHDQVNDINHKLIGGASSRELGRQYNLGYKSVQNHRNKHLPQQLVKAKDLQEENVADQLLARAQDLYDKSLRIIEKADSEKKWASATGAIREARQSLELVAKLVGQLKTGTTINLVYNPEFIETRVAITNALRNFPEAKQAVIEALTERGVYDVEYEEVTPAQLGPGQIR